MGIVKLLLVGAAAAVAYNYLTKKRADGTSLADDIKTQAPEWMDKAKPYIDKVTHQVSSKFKTVMN